MPIYAYRCADCGHSKDVLQKLSDAVLTTCPACGQEAFSKQLTAAGFQLKGSGWYATDFKSGSAAPAKADAGTGEGKGDGKSEGTGGGDAKPAAPAEGSASAAGCGTSCACH